MCPLFGFDLVRAYSEYKLFRDSITSSRKLGCSDRSFFFWKVFEIEEGSREWKERISFSIFRFWNSRNFCLGVFFSFEI